MAESQKEGRNRIEFRFPGHRKQALTFSYDDAQVHDRRLVGLFNSFGMKGTFHLNSGMLNTEGFITREEVRELYNGHEVACHGVTHPFCNRLSQGMMASELYEDRRILETCSGGMVRGMSYPYGEYNEEFIETARRMGIVYSRTTQSTKDFHLPSDFMLWHPTCHQSEIRSDLLDDFLNPPDWRELSLFYIWGHSFEFREEREWSCFQQICEAMGQRDDVWYATNIEIYEYVTAMRSLAVSVDGSILYNPSAVTVDILVNGSPVSLPGGGSWRKTGHSFS